jgi:hypothetical protein
MYARLPENQTPAHWEGVKVCHLIQKKPFTELASLSETGSNKAQMKK